MRKLALVSAISAISASIALPALASSMTCSVGGGANNGLVYTTTATSNGITVSALTTTVTYYVDNSLGSASNKTNPAPPPPNPYTLIVNGNWCIDTNSGAFAGSIRYGNYKTQTNVTGVPTIDGRETFVGVTQTFGGLGTMTSGGAPTISFSASAATGVSTQTEVSSACANGQTSALGKVCSSFATASQDWEGISFLFTFDPTYYTFTGSLTGVDVRGTGLMLKTTNFIWTIDGVDPPAEVPLPATAWLFGSAVGGLGVARRRTRKNPSRSQ